MPALSLRTRARATRRSAAALLVVGAAIVAGCTSSSGSDTTTTEPAAEERLDEQAFVMDFGETCAAIGEEINAAPEPSSYEELTAQAETAKSITLAGLTQLEAIRPPVELQEQVDEILTMFEDYADGFDDLAAAASASDDARLDELVLEITDAQVKIGTELIAAKIDCGSLTALAELRGDGS